MKKLIFVLVVAAIAAIPGQLFAQTAQGTATATVGTPITVTANAIQMNFGAMNASAALGTCVVDTKGVVTVTGGVTKNGGSPTAGSFSVSGKVSAVYNIVLPSTSVVLTRTGGAETMSVTNFLAEATSGTIPATTGTLDAGTGMDSFAVGATLHVNASQLDGIYTGTYNVSVAYQ